MLEEFAAKEHRSLGNLCFVLLTWATEQLQKAGTIERLLGKRVPIPKQGLQKNRIGRTDVPHRSDLEDTKPGLRAKEFEPRVSSRRTSLGDGGNLR
jgi:hypothetical protein